MNSKCKYCLGSGRDELLHQNYTPNDADECPFCDGTELKNNRNEED